MHMIIDLLIFKMLIFMLQDVADQKFFSCYINPGDGKFTCGQPFDGQSPDTLFGATFKTEYVLFFVGASSLQLASLSNFSFFCGLSKIHSPEYS